MSREQRFRVPEKENGERLDRCLTHLAGKNWTRSRIRKLIDGGLVLLNAAIARPAERVRAGDEIVLIIKEPAAAENVPQDIPLEILFEDADLLVCNKPPGLVIHPAAGNPSGTLVNALLHHCTDLSGIGGVERPGIVHRLDKDTSGALVVAKNDSAHLALSMAFSRREIEKHYLALCYGNLTEKEGVFDFPIGRHPNQRKQMSVRPDGKPARTLYRVIEESNGLSLLDCRLITGRTHQIRVHLSHAGHALVGDASYAGRQWKNLPSVRTRILCRDFPRQALHSYRLGFSHPSSGIRMEFTAPLPEDLAVLLEELGFQAL